MSLVDADQFLARWLLGIALLIPSCALGDGDDGSETGAGTGGTGGPRTSALGGATATTSKGTGAALAGTASAGANTMSTGSVSLERLGEINVGNVTMRVDPKLGGRVISLTLSGKEILLQAESVAGTENANNFGITFWPSPQSAWGWPPPAAIDSEPYQAKVVTGTLLLTSEGATLGDGAVVALSKQFAPVAGKDAIDITYQLTNVGAVETTVACWQIARVPSYGLTFFRLGPGGVASDKLETATVEGVQWYEYDAAVVVEQGQKTFADARGWVAHVEAGVVFVLVFPDLAPGEAAAGEAELELYADPSHTYIEIEPQGKALPLSPGKSLPAFRVRHILATLPTGIAASAGNPALVAFVESLIAE